VRPSCTSSAIAALRRASLAFYCARWPDIGFIPNCRVCLSLPSPRSKSSPVRVPRFLPGNDPNPQSAGRYRFRGDRRNEHHVVKGCDQKAPVGQEQVGVVHQLPVEMILRFGAVFRQGRHELQFAASAAAGHAPRDVVPFQDCIEAVGETLLPGKHLLESFSVATFPRSFTFRGRLSQLASDRRHRTSRGPA
jgi:hypothetical protein